MNVPVVRLEFAYDAQSRRIQKKVLSGLVGETFSTTNTSVFLYDGWNLISEVRRGIPAAPSCTNLYFWGLDLSGSMQGAGGIGGLLFASLGGTTASSSVFYAFDGNGNLAALVDANDGTIAASYEYSPFGESIRATGPLAEVNPFRFSSKYADDETGLVYYGYRFYCPELGRWLSRDPIGNRGGIALHIFVANGPIHRFDPRGLQIFPGPSPGGNAPPSSVSAYCCGTPVTVYSPTTHCCCKNGTTVSSDLSSACKVVDRTEIASGVKRHKGTLSYQIPGAPTQVHVWLEWKGYGYDGSADANGANDSIIHAGATGAILQIDDSDSPTDVKLKPCEYDFKKFHKCLSDTATPLDGGTESDCIHFADITLVAHCKADSATKGCTAP
jgi:RHS repeat-associated protein